MYRPASGPALNPGHLVLILPKDDLDLGRFGHHTLTLINVHSDDHPLNKKERCLAENNVEQTSQSSPVLCTT